MADWSRDKVDASNLNNGQEYTLDSDVSLEQLNAVVNNSLYAGDFVEELTNIDTTNINNVGEANVRVESSPNATPTKPYKRLVFENLKGEPGKDGVIGKDGKSAYEYAQDGGYTGTEQEFASELSSIQNKYEKPSNGIPKTDLSSGVQTSLEKADTAVQPSSLGTLASKNAVDYNTEVTNKPTIPSIEGLATEDYVDDKVAGLNQTINSLEETVSKKASQEDLDSTNTRIDNLKASDVNALPDTTKYGASLDLSINNETYVMTAQLKDQDGNNLGTAKTIDLPLESVVVGAEQVGTKLVLTLQNGNTTEVDISSLLSGLVPDTRKINGKDLKTDITLTNEDIGLTKVSQLENDSGFISTYTETDPTVPAWAKEPTKPSYNYSEINNTPTIPTVNDATVLITQGGNFKGSFTLNQSTGVHIALDEGGGEAPTVTVDSALSETSTNPVQNKVIKEALSTISQNVNLLSEQKANSDATNLTELNIAAWKEKLQLGLPIGMIISSTIVQNNAGLRLLDGSSLLLNGAYKAFCDYLVARYLEDTTNVPVCSMQEYANDMNDYGQCGCFVYNDGSSTLISTARNSTDLIYSVPANSLKLPTITKHIEGLTDISQLGKALGAGLPNITGYGYIDRKSDNTTLLPHQDEWSGALRVEYIAGNSHSTPSNNSQSRGTDRISIDASLSSDIYGNSDTVQTQSVRYPHYIVVATVTKTDIEVNIDNIASDLNNLSNAVQNKAQSDLSNVANSVLKNKALSLTTLWEGSRTSTGTFSLSQSFLNFNFLYFWGRNSGNEYVSWIVSTDNFNSSTSSNPYDCGNNTKDANRYVNLYKASDTSITVKSIGSMTLLGVYGL